MYCVCYEVIEKQQRAKEMGDIKVKMEAERLKLDIQLRDLQVYAENREKNEKQTIELKQRIEYEKADKVRELADKQRQKVQATDKLRDEMLKKIRQMRANLLSLKKQQLSTTTRLTILQNHQLTSELQYQSKQTQKLIFKEEEMCNKIKKLSQEVVIHEQVEEELAKRAHFSKGVIKKLNEKVNQLQSELRELRNNNEFARMNGSAMRKNSSQKIIQNNRSKVLNDDESRINENIDKALDNAEKHRSELQTKLQAEKKQKNSLLAQLSKNEQMVNKLGKMLIVYSEQILNSPVQGANKQNSFLNGEQQEKITKINLKQLRSKEIQEWSHDEVSFITKMLIHQIKPFLDRKNVLIPAIRRLLIIEDHKDREVRDFSLNCSQSRLPKLLGETDKNNTSNSYYNKPGLKQLPTNIASKIVGSNLRQWGSTVNTKSLNKKISSSCIKRRYKIQQSSR